MEIWRGKWPKKKKEKPGSKRGTSEPGGKCALAMLSLAVATKQRLPAGGASSSLLEGFQLRVSAMSSRSASNGPESQLVLPNETVTLQETANARVPPAFPREALTRASQWAAPGKAGDQLVIWDVHETREV